MLPALIREAETAGCAAGGDSREACSVRAMVYDTAAALLHRVGVSSLAWTAADRALAAAEQTGRPELVALQAWTTSPSTSVSASRWTTGAAWRNSGIAYRPVRETMLDHYESWRAKRAARRA